MPIINCPLQADPNPIELIERRKRENKPFAIIHDGRSIAATILAGDVKEYDSLDDIEKSRPIYGDYREPRYDAVGIVPYDQITECGLPAVESDVRMRVMHVTEQTKMLVVDCIEMPQEGITELQEDMESAVCKEECEKAVDRIITEHICKGDICNMTFSIKFEGVLKEISTSAAIKIFQRVLSREYGAYMTYFFFDGKEYHIAASPEMHYAQYGCYAYMTPISGTIHKKFEGLSPEKLKEFFEDEKEVNELFMCVDEELKKMAQICENGGVIIGPELREMSNVVHSEYLLVGRTIKDCYEMFKVSMHPATVTGSPQEPATGIIADMEKEPRNYYAGAFFLHGYNDGSEFLNSAIHIRGLRILPSGLCEMRVGATIVRDSKGSKEYNEMLSKAAGVIQGFKDNLEPPTPPVLSSMLDDALLRIFRERNLRCNKFLFECQKEKDNSVNELKGKRVKVIASDDDFSYQLKHMITAMGAKAEVVSYKEFDANQDGSDIVVIGPGSGNPAEKGDSANALKMRRISEIAKTLLKRKIPLLGVCLGHQLICEALGLELVQKDDPTQGVQKKISFFGQEEYVGFYNAYAAKTADVDGVDICADERTGEVHAVHGERFSGLQFHPESLRTQNGFSILTEELKRII